MIEIRYAFIDKVDKLDINVLPTEVIDHINSIKNESRRNQSLACWSLLNKLVYSYYNKNLCDVPLDIKKMVNRYLMIFLFPLHIAITLFVVL